MIIYDMISNGGISLFNDKLGWKGGQTNPLIRKHRNLMATGTFGRLTLAFHVTEAD